MKAIESRKPAMKMCFFLLSLLYFKRKIAERIIGRCIKFSAFAIFPSIIGLPKNTTYKNVER